MASSSDLVDVFNECIDRLNIGEEVDTILLDYPTFATQLRPMLRAGLLTHKARYPAVQVELAHERIQPIIQQAVETTFGSSAFGLWMGVVLFLLLGGGALLVGVFTFNNAGDQRSTLAPTTMPTDAETLTTNPPVAISSIPTITTAPVANESLEPPTILIMEGPITDISNNIVTVFDTEFQLAVNDPLLTVIQIGDVARITGTTSTDSIVVVNIIIINVTIVVNDNGTAWRDDNCGNAPPAWVNDEASGWYNRCVGSQNPGRSRGSGSS